MKQIALTLAVLFGALTVAQAQGGSSDDRKLNNKASDEVVASADETAPKGKKPADEKTAAE